MSALLPLGSVASEAAVDGTENGEPQRIPAELLTRHGMSPYHDISKIDLPAPPGSSPTPFHQVPLVEFDANFVDRSAFANVLKELDGLELIRLWQNDKVRLFIGVGSSGLAGINLTQRKSRSRRKAPIERTANYAAIIDALLTEAQESDAVLLAAIEAD